MSYLLTNGDTHYATKSARDPDSLFAALIVAGLSGVTRFAPDTPGISASSCNDSAQILTLSRSGSVEFSRH